MRRLFRIHLSTALRLMILASVLLCANVNHGAGHYFNAGSSVYIKTYGWPYYFKFTHIALDNEEAATQGDSDFVEWSSLTWDGFICILILAFGGTICEWRIRRHEACKH